MPKTSKSRHSRKPQALYASIDSDTLFSTKPQALYASLDSDTLFSTTAQTPPSSPISTTSSQETPVFSRPIHIDLAKWNGAKALTKFNMLVPIPTSRPGHDFPYEHTNLPELVGAYKDRLCKKCKSPYRSIPHRGLCCYRCLTWCDFCKIGFKLNGCNTHAKRCPYAATRINSDEGIQNTFHELDALYETLEKLDARCMAHEQTIATFETEIAAMQKKLPKLRTRMQTTSFNHPSYFTHCTRYSVLQFSMQDLQAALDDERKQLAVEKAQQPFMEEKLEALRKRASAQEHHRYLRFATHQTVTRDFYENWNIQLTAPCQGCNEDIKAPVAPNNDKQPSFLLYIASCQCAPIKTGTFLCKNCADSTPCTTCHAKLRPITIPDMSLAFTSTFPAPIPYVSSASTAATIASTPPTTPAFLPSSPSMVNTTSSPTSVQSAGLIDKRPLAGKRLPAGKGLPANMDLYYTCHAKRVATPTITTTSCKRAANSLDSAAMPASKRPRWGMKAPRYVPAAT